MDIGRNVSGRDPWKREREKEKKGRGQILNRSKQMAPRSLILGILFLEERKLYELRDKMIKLFLTGGKWKLYG